MTASFQVAPSTNTDRRIGGLDGLRGLACAMVVISHFFGEVPHGIQPAMVGWIAVDIFFVLSGFLIGRLILEKKAHRNFFVVFYARRFFRLVPPYLMTLSVIFILLQLLPVTWTEATGLFPFAAYLGFLQNA